MLISLEMLFGFLLYQLIVISNNTIMLYLAAGELQVAEGGQGGEGAQVAAAQRVVRQVQVLQLF